MDRRQCHVDGLECVDQIDILSEFSKRKSVLIVCQLQPDVPVTEFFEFNLHVNFLYFL